MLEAGPLRVVVTGDSHPGDDDAGCALWHADLVQGDSSPLVTLSLIQALTPRAKPWVIAADVLGLPAGRDVARVWHSQRGVAGDCVVAEAIERPPHRADFEQALRYTAGDAMRVLRSPALHIAFDAGGEDAGWVEKVSQSGRFGLTTPLSRAERLLLSDTIGSAHRGLRVVG